MDNNESQQQYEAAQSRTEAKLRYAIVHLQELQNADRRGDDFDRAHQESFLFHLTGVRDAYLQELNILLGCGLQPRQVTKGRLEKTLAKMGIHSAALNRLTEIETDPDSWLSYALEMRHHSTHRQNVPRVYLKGGENDGDVHLTDPRTGQAIEDDYLRVYLQWVDEMGCLVSELRACD